MKKGVSCPTPPPVRNCLKVHSHACTISLPCLRRQMEHSGCRSLTTLATPASKSSPVQWCVCSPDRVMEAMVYPTENSPLASHHQRDSATFQQRDGSRSRRVWMASEVVIGSQVEGDSKRFPHSKRKFRCPRVNRLVPCERRIGIPGL